MIEVLTRQEAKALGVTRYFTGQPCPKGHVSERLVSSASCLVCTAERKRGWNKANRATATETSREWRNANRDKVRATKAAWNKANPDGQKARSRRWYLANKDNADASHARWREGNLDVAAAAQARRRAKKVSQTPMWADHSKMRSIYSEARRLAAETGEQYHVDHIVPLQSGLVCGLHAESNLQILHGHINRSKSNRLWPQSFQE